MSRTHLLLCFLLLLACTQISTKTHDVLKKITDPENIVPGASPANSPILDLNIKHNNQFSLSLSEDLLTKIAAKEQVLTIEVDGDFQGQITFKSTRGLKADATCNFKANRTRICPITHEHKLLKSLQKSGKLIGIIAPEEAGSKAAMSMTLQFYHSRKIVIDLDSDLEIDTSGVSELNLLARYPEPITKNERIRLQFEGSLKNKKANFLGYGMPNDTLVDPTAKPFKLSRFSNRFIGFIMDQKTPLKCDYNKCLISIL
jgi:hypothetical protein